MKFCCKVLEVNLTKFGKLVFSHLRWITDRLESVMQYMLLILIVIIVNFFSTSIF